MFISLPLRAYRALFSTSIALLIASCVQLPSAAQDLKITVENLSPSSGFFLTPVWYGLHSGDFDLFDIGGNASSAIEAIAEEGDVSGLQSDFSAPGRLQGVITGPAGFGSMAPQPPLIDTGEVATVIQTTMNPSAYRYFSFASMVIPSNDAFIGNENPMAYEVFDSAGNFNGDLTIDLFGADIWDAGTEVNNTVGAAFSTLGGVGTTEGGTIQVHPGLTNFEGTGTPVGNIGIGTAPSLTTPLARITITRVPEPTTALMGTVALMGLGLARRKCI